jgi:hypothetical protein
MHVPEEAILSRFRKDFRGEARKALKRLAKHPQRYILRHPGRKMTYHLTKTGKNKLKELGIING